ncbi:MAG: protein kinase [Nevskia sp.]|nr:protein kinase [Nevskia sp.]
MYAVGGWLLVQVVTQVFPIFDIAPVVQRIIVLVVVAGFPLALVLAWVFDVTPLGIVRTADAPARDDEAAAERKHRGLDRTLNYVLGGLLLLALGYFMLDRWLFAPQLAGTAPANAATSIEGKPATISRSIAVLPFADMSQAGDQAYFSDGMSEELLNLLSQVPELHVAGRTSSFSFKGKNATIAEIGKALNVATVLEGSVRKAGDRLRITAQLINVADGYHLWSQSYDRKLTDVFATQDDIAGAVADALKLKLLPAQRPSTARHHVPSFETYDHYLLGRQLLMRSEPAGYGRAVDAFRRAVASDPDYAAAYAGLAMAESFAVEESVDASLIAQGNQRAMAAAERAVALDSELGDAYSARGYLRGTNEWDWDGALADQLKAVRLDPGDSKNQLRYGYLLATLGRLPEASIALSRSVALDPLFTPAWYWLGRVKTALTDFDGARLALQRALAIDPGFQSASSYLGILALLQGDPATARRTFIELKRPFGLVLAEYDLGNAAQSQRALEQLIAQHGRNGPYLIATAFAWRGDRDQAFAWLERAIAQHDPDLVSLKYDPILRKLRDDPRYRATLRKLQLPE